MKNTNRQLILFCIKNQTVITRLDQFKEMRSTVEEFLQKYGFQRGDICVFVGDFNCDARNSIHPIDFLSKSQKMKEHIGVNETQETFDEYKALIDILSGKGKDTLIDVGRPPVTFADVYKNQFGEIKPLEIALTDTRDLKSMQSLDYIVQIIPNGMIIDNHNNHNNNTFSKYASIQMSQFVNGGFSIKNSNYQSFMQNSNNSMIMPASKQFLEKTLTVDLKKSGVEKFFVKGEKYTQLSDHYGLSATFRYQ